MSQPKPAHFLSSESGSVRYLEKTNPHSSNLQFLTYGVYELDGLARSGAFVHASEEALLFCWKGAVLVTVNEQGFQLDHYDVLYIPRGATYRLSQGEGHSKVIVCRAPADKTHAVFHARWKEFSQNEKRIRHLKGKDVFLMFDVSELAEKLIAGYTIFQPHQRSWPPHNHTDQEEIYIFTKGRGSMEVYADEETKSFVCSVGEGDAVTIPLLNYHPVFSQEEELHFIWCIAGNRYWVGDKNKDFMTGKVDKLTTQTEKPELPTVFPISESLASGKTIREPAGFENGYWAGAPGVFYAADERAWYLTYRLRRPRGVAPDRGGEARVARSADLQNWEDVWSVTKDKFGSASIERSAIRKGQDGLWRYFTSYVDPADGRWCVSVLKSKDVRKLNPSEPKSLFKAASLDLEGIKDPWILAHEGAFYMFLSVALPTPKTSQQSHSTLDIYNTGECLSATGLAISRDLENWQWQGVVFKPGASGWDCYCRRINSVVPYHRKFIAFYDGSASHGENYEEKTGLAVSSDLRRWECLSPSGPMLTSPHGSGSLRYMDAQPANDSPDSLNLFYEFARPDFSHDLRLAALTAETLFGSKVGE